MASRKSLLSKAESIQVSLLEPYSAEKGARRSELYIRSRYTTILDTLCNSWYGEGVAITFSFACFVTIGIVLQVYDGQHVPSLPQGITLNAVISLLATAAKSALIFTVASNLSQWKWIWYYQQKARRLRDFQTFDDASRGPLGAIQMFFNETRFSIGTLGAFIVILATTYDPFIQQLLTLPTKTVYKKSEFAWVSQFKTLPPKNTLAILLAEPLKNVANNESVKMFNASPTCGAMNCTYDTYQSLGFCARCENVTSSVRLENCSLTPDSFAGYDIEALRNEAILTKTCSIQWNQDLSNSIDIQLNGTQPTVAMPLHYIDLIYNHSTIMADHIVNSTGEYISGEVVYTKNITALNVSNPLLVFGQADFQKTDDMMLDIKGATICTLDLCLSSYDTNVTYNIPFIQARNESHGLKFNVSSSGNVMENNIRGSFWNCWAPNLTLYDAHVQDFDPMSPMATPHAKDDFTFCYEAALTPSTTFADLLSPHLPGLLSTQDLVFGLNSSGQLTGPTVREAWFSQSGSVLFQMGLDKFVLNASTAMTQVMLTNSGSRVAGRTGFATILVHVRWLWFILPLLTEIFGVVFMVLTIRATSKQQIPLWKASVLPHLFHGLEHDTEVLSSDVMRMHDIAENMNVSLIRKDDDNGRLVLKQHVD